jgi:hypothetical protein
MDAPKSPGMILQGTPVFTPGPPWLDLKDPTLGPLVAGIEPAVKPSIFLWGLHWGARTYLIPADGLESFCLAVKHGQEPRSITKGKYFLHLGDEKKPAYPKDGPAECQAQP